MTRHSRGFLMSGGEPESQSQVVRVSSQSKTIVGNTPNRLTVDPDWETIPDNTSLYLISGPGGLGERGGNDFVVFNNARNGESIESLMHELGHTLNLGHGGDENHNCKPNYVSIMNYDHDGGINTTGGVIFDFSPPRHAGDPPRTLPTAPEDRLDENDLNETVPLDAMDAQNFFVFKCVKDNGENGDEGSCSDEEDNDDDGLSDLDDPDCYQPKRWPLNKAVDWDATNMEMVMDCEGAAETLSVKRNIDFGGPGDCQKLDDPDRPNREIGEIRGHDDWSNIALSFVEFGDNADTPATDVPSEWTMEEQQQYGELLDTTDISIVKTGSPDPVEVGADLVYTLTVSNNGPQPAFLTKVIDTLPESVSYLGDASECIEDPVGVLTCDAGTIEAGEETQIEITVSTASACDGGLPQELINSATVGHGENSEGPDPDTDNNSTDLSVVPVDTTPPQIESLSVSPEALWPPDHTMRPVSISVTASDLCDPAPVCRLASITSNEPANDIGDGNTSTDWEITGEFTANLRAERDGRKGGRIYTLTAECVDASGNSASGTVTVTVAHDKKVK